MSPARLSFMTAHGGYTLVEVVISMLLTAIMVSAVMSVALTARRGSVRNDRRLVANQASRQLTAMLRAYVTADPATTTIAGPGTGTNKWSMTSAAGPNQIADCYTCAPAAACPPSPPCPCTCPGVCDCYALAPGSHTLTGFLPSWFYAAPYNATMKYFVAKPATPMDAPLVNVTVDWTEP